MHEDHAVYAARLPKAQEWTPCEQWDGGVMYAYGDRRPSVFAPTRMRANHAEIIDAAIVKISEAERVPEEKTLAQLELHPHLVALRSNLRPLSRILNGKPFVWGHLIGERYNVWITMPQTSGYGAFDALKDGATPAEAAEKCLGWFRTKVTGVAERCAKEAKQATAFAGKWQKAAGTL